MKLICHVHNRSVVATRHHHSFDLCASEFYLGNGFNLAPSRIQCDQIGRILQVLGNKLSHQSSPNILVPFGLFLIMSLLCKKCVATIWAILGRNWVTFYSIIWSHLSWYKWIYPRKNNGFNNLPWTLLRYISLAYYALIIEKATIIWIQCRGEESTFGQSQRPKLEW